MSSMPTYVLICDGDGCAERFVSEGDPQRLVGEVRTQAAFYKWTHAVVPRDKPQVGRNPTKDFCPACSQKQVKAA